MRISHKHRFVYINNPRAGSHAINAICDVYWSAFVVSDDHHALYSACPEDCRDYFVWSVIRHPVRRMISWWLYDQRYEKKPLSLSAYVYRCLERRGNPRYPADQPQLVRAKDAQCIFRLEELPQALSVLPWVKTRPVFERRNHVAGPRIRNDEISDALVEKILEYEGDGIRHFYPMAAP